MAVKSIHSPTIDASPIIPRFAIYVVNAVPPSIVTVNVRSTYIHVARHDYGFRDGLPRPPDFGKPQRRRFCQSTSVMHGTRFAALQPRRRLWNIPMRRRNLPSFRPPKLLIGLDVVIRAAVLIGPAVGWFRFAFVIREPEMCVYPLNG